MCLQKPALTIGCVSAFVSLLNPTPLTIRFLPSHKPKLTILATLHLLAEECSLWPICSSRNWNQLNLSPQLKPSYQPRDHPPMSLWTEGRTLRRV